MINVKKRLLASDIEAKGLYDKVNVKDDVHCLCSIDIETDEVFLFHDHPEFDLSEVLDPYDNNVYVIPERTGTLDEGILFWKESVDAGSTLVIHNAMTYDHPVVDKIWPDIGIPLEAYHDTLVQSKVQWFERPTPKGSKGAHGLQAWGKRLGINKPEVTEWDTIDAFKMHRVIEDCRIQRDTYIKLEKERQFLKESYGIDFTAALRIESLYAKLCFEQEQRGARVDVEHMRRCIEELDLLIETLRSEIEPQLPPTLKGSGGKVSRSEMAEIFGYDSSRIRDKIVKRKRNGEVEEVVEKPYYKPCVNFTRLEKKTEYCGFHLEYDFSPVFKKRKDLTDWIKNTHPDTKTKEWNIDKNVIETKVLNKNTCEYWDLPETATDIVAGPYTKVVMEPTKLTQSGEVKAFLITLGWTDADEWNLATDVYGNRIKVEEDTTVYWPEKASKDNQISIDLHKGEYMVSSPKLTEKDYEQLPEGLGKKIGQYNTYQHRRRFLENPKDPEEKGLMSYVREDGRIPAGINNFNTRSGRSSHRVWVNPPGVGALYGEEVRKCIVAGKGKKLVGIDMKSAQLSIAAYYANNQEYYDTVASGLEETEDHVYLGESAHCVNCRMFGMVSEEEWKRAVRTQDKDLIHHISLKRKGSKGGSFAVIFGASGKKVARTIGIPEKEGNKRKSQFLEQVGLDECMSVLDEMSKKYPYKSGFMLPLAFGYWLWNNSTHKSFNTIDQGFEGLAQKLAAIKMDKWIKEECLDEHIGVIIQMHDESLFEVTEGYEDVCGKMAGECYTWAAEQIFNFHTKYPHMFANKQPPKFAIDLNGGYKVGNNYLECH